MSEYFSGLDLGQAQDYSAFVVDEVSRINAPNDGSVVQLRHDVLFVQRWQLKTPYTTIVSDLKNSYSTPPLKGSTLVVDGTGVGVAVVDMVREAKFSAAIRSYCVTAGFREGDGTVPKRDLVGAVVSAMESRRLRLSEEMPLKVVLESELQHFAAKVTEDRNETFAAWRERDHDDILFALALAVWYGEKHFGGSLPVKKPILKDPWGPATSGPGVWSDPRFK